MNGLVTLVSPRKLVQPMQGLFQKRCSSHYILIVRCHRIPLRRMSDTRLSPLSQLHQVSPWVKDLSAIRIEAGQTCLDRVATGPDMNRSSRYTKMPSFGFGTQSRQPKIPSETPGPGEYKPLATLGGGTQYSCTPRRREVSRLGHGVKVPGPGDHNMPETLGHGKLGGPKITMTPRRENQDDFSYMAKNPGPGEYDTLGLRKAKVNPVKVQSGFGRARQRARLPAELQPPTPGPGSYRVYEELPHAPR